MAGVARQIGEQTGAFRTQGHDVFDGYQRVLIDSVLVVEIAEGQAFDAGPTGEHAAENSGVMHFPQCGGVHEDFGKLAPTSGVGNEDGSSRVKPGSNGAVHFACGAEVIGHDGVGRGADFILRSEGEDVGIVVEEAMQFAAHCGEHLFGLFETLRGLEPMEDVEVAEAAWAVFYVGFQVIDGVVVLAVPFAGELGGGKLDLFVLPGEKAVKAVVEFGPDSWITSEEPAVQEAEREFGVAFVQLEAIGNGMRALTDAKAAVPKFPPKRRELWSNPGRTD